MKHSAITLLKKVLVYCAGLFIMAMGVSFSGTADLGMSPVNSIPYVLSEIFTFLSMGTWIIVIFSLYILIQFLILGRDLQPARVLQLICTTLFGYFTDFTNFLADRFLPDPASLSLSPAGIYGVRLLYLAISMALIALGILLYLAPCLISLPGEGIMQVIADKLHLPLHTVKMCFDITVVPDRAGHLAGLLPTVPRHPGGHRDRGVRRGQDPGPVRAAEAPRAPVHVRAGSRVILYTAIPRRPGRLPGDFFSSGCVQNTGIPLRPLTESKVAHKSRAVPLHCPASA